MRHLPALEAAGQVTVGLAPQQARHRAFDFGHLAIDISPGLGHAHPQRLLGPGQCHIEQANVLLQTQRIVVAAGTRLGPIARHKGQEHQRVLQALGLVQGDDLHQVGVALQAQLRHVPGSLRPAQLVFQVTHQRALALKPHAGGLQ